MIKLLLLISLIVSASGLVEAQGPPIGIIDFYGLRTVSEQRVREALQIKEGDQVPASRLEAQRRLEQLPNVQQALISATCCEAGKVILYVGIKENGAPSLKFRAPPPKGTIRLPEVIINAGRAFDDALSEGLQMGEAGEDDSQGHALNSYPKLRAIQERFITFAAQNPRLLRSVLHESVDSQHRALAAQVIAYVPNKRDVVEDLVYGMSDPESDVRNNSMRALAIIAGFARRDSQRIKVPVKPFVDMLNSIVWTDRNKSSFALCRLTDTRDAAVLSMLRERALPSLVEMSRWKSPGHSSCPFFLLGRAGNIPEVEIQKAWDSGNRETLIETVLRSAKAK
jgi:hypothetical protein